MPNKKKDNGKIVTRERIDIENINGERILSKVGMVVEVNNKEITNRNSIDNEVPKMHFPDFRATEEKDYNKEDEIYNYDDADDDPLDEHSYKPDYFDNSMPSKTQFDKKEIIDCVKKRRDIDMTDTIIGTQVLEGKAELTGTITSDCDFKLGGIIPGSKDEKQDFLLTGIIPAKNFGLVGIKYGTEDKKGGTLREKIEKEIIPHMENEEIDVIKGQIRHEKKNIGKSRRRK